MFLCININFIIICSLMHFNKNRTNNWKNTKLWGTDYQYLNHPQPKDSCLRHFGSWVIRLNVYNIKFIIICSLTNFNKNRTNNWKNTKLWGTHYQYLNNPEWKFPCFRHFGSWVIRLNVSMHKYKFYSYMLSDEL